MFVTITKNIGTNYGISTYISPKSELYCKSWYLFGSFFQILGLYCFSAINFKNVSQMTCSRSFTTHMATRACIKPLRLWRVFSMPQFLIFTALFSWRTWGGGISKGMLKLSPNGPTRWASTISLSTSAWEGSGYVTFVYWLFHLGLRCFSPMHLNKFTFLQVRKRFQISKNHFLSLIWSTRWMSVGLFTYYHAPYFWRIFVTYYIILHLSSVLKTLNIIHINSCTTKYVLKAYVYIRWNRWNAWLWSCLYTKKNIFDHWQRSSTLIEVVQNFITALQIYLGSISCTFVKTSEVFLFFFKQYMFPMFWPIRTSHFHNPQFQDIHFVYSSYEQVRPFFVYFHPF